MLLEAELPDGDRCSVLLQNAETVRVVGPGVAPSGQLQEQQRRQRQEEQGWQLEACSGQQSGGGNVVDDGQQREQQQGGGEPEQGCSSWHAVSVSQVAVGDRLLVLRQPGARHTGVAIEESITER